VSPEEIEKALSTLDMIWGGDACQFGRDPDDSRWWVIKGGRVASLLKAGSPEELNRMLADREAAGR
jgi:hypothetical protein